MVENLLHKGLDGHLPPPQQRQAEVLVEQNLGRILEAVDVDRGRGRAHAPIGIGQRFVNDMRGIGVAFSTVEEKPVLICVVAC
jgi:hypothetical protein